MSNPYKLLAGGLLAGSLISMAFRAEADGTWVEVYRSDFTTAATSDAQFQSIYGRNGSLVAMHTVPALAASIGTGTGLGVWQSVSSAVKLAEATSGNLGLAPALAPAPAPAPSGKWMSGASSPEAANGSFGSWRGETLGIGGIWVDGNDFMLQLYPLQPGAEWGAWSGPLDVAIGAICQFQSEGCPQGRESWGAAARGAYDARWRQSAKNFKAVWTDRGKPESNLYVRFAHEMNGNWYPWRVAQGQEANFKAAWIRWSNIMDQELPEAKKVWSVNKDTSDGYASTRNIWPGKQYVDVYAIDWYNVYPHCATVACLRAAFSRTDDNGAPVGPEAHRKEAERLGMPFAISEWANSAPTYANQDGGGGESPVFMTYMNNWMRAHAGSGPGQLTYEVLFNLWDRYAIYSSEAHQPVTAKRYRQLTWGQ